LVEFFITHFLPVDLGYSGNELALATLSCVVSEFLQQSRQSYGTILVDLEPGSTIDLLPDWEVSSLATWLKQNPGVELISRDRAGAYSDGARQGAPSAIQIADRWHLNKNMTEAVERFPDTKHLCLRQAASKVNKSVADAE
jgi:transposase